MKKMLAVIVLLCYITVVLSTSVGAVLFMECSCLGCDCDGNCYCDENVACDCDANVKKRECSENQTQTVICACIAASADVKLVCAGVDSDCDLEDAIAKSKNRIKPGVKMNN